MGGPAAGELDTRLKRRRRRAGTIAGAVAAAILTAFPGAAAAGEETQAGSLAAHYGAAWLALQTGDGRFRDYVSGAADGHGRYGEAMLGYALLQVGLRDGNQAHVDAGLRAIGFALSHPELQDAERSVFEMYALAAAYNLASRALAGDARFVGMAAAWAQRLQSERPAQLRGRLRYWNKSIVEAVGVLQLLRTRLRSSVAGAWLQDPHRARVWVKRLVNRTTPRLAPRRAGRVMLSDPPAHPLAYHALSLGFYARAVRLLGRKARPPARRTLVGAARMSLALAAPDGDLAYVGRSQEQAWALSFTAYGAEAAARLARRRKVAARLRALAGRALSRLQALHPVTAGGLAIVPAFAGGVQPWYRGIDGYAGAPGYAGLTIAGLGLAADLGVAARPGARIASDVGLAASIPAGAGDMAVLRRGPVWLAVKRVRFGADLRYDFGLVGLKWLSAAGWQDVIPNRPRAVAPSLGPTLLLAGAEHEPFGRRIRASRRRIRVTGGFLGIRGRVAFSYVPSRCGAELRFRGSPGATYRYSTFLPAQSAPRVDGDRSVVGVGQRLTVSAPASLQLTGGFSSAMERDLIRADLTFAAGRSGRVVVSSCVG